jgi:hypothetical protein
MQKSTIKQNFCFGIIFMVIEFMASDLSAQELMPNMPATLKCGIGKSLKCEN